MNENETPRCFQWIASDKKGQIVFLDKIEIDDGIVFLSFKDGSRMNEAFIAPLNQKDLNGVFYMAEIDHPNNCWQFKEEWVGRQEEVWAFIDETNPTEKVCIQEAISGRKVMKLIPPRPTTPKTSNFISNSLPETPSPLISINESDPVYIMLTKSKKIDNKIEMSIIIAMPPKNLYNIAKESFDEGDTKFVKYIIENIDTNEIREALKIAITNMYEQKENKDSAGISIFEHD